MTPQEALHNFQVIAEKYNGPLSHHQAIGQSISVLRAFIDEHTPKEVPVESSAGGIAVPEGLQDPTIISPKSKRPKKSSKKS